MKKSKIFGSVPIVLACLMVVLGGVSAVQVAPPTVTKTIDPADVGLAYCGLDDEFTVTIEVTGAGGTSSEALPMDVVFALDSSGSMAWNDPSGIRKTASKSFVDQMDSLKDQAGVVSWDENVDFTQALTNNFVLVKSKIDAVDSSGGTNLNAGLNSAISVMDAGAQAGSSRAIIFLTDGQGTYTSCAGNGPAKVAADKGYVIYSIGLGTPAVGPLQDMATCTGGQYFSAPTPANLQAIFDAIYTQIIVDTIPYNVDVIEVTQANIVDIDNFLIYPDSMIQNANGETVMIWYDIGSGDFPADESVLLSFTAKSDTVGNNQEVQVAGAAVVNYNDKDSNPAGSVDIPQAYINTEDGDEDDDGVCDVDDRCAGSTEDGLELNPNQYAQNIDFGPFEVGPDNLQSIVYDMATTYGCTCTQIVEELGIGKGHLKKGCSPGIMQEWTGIAQEPDRHLI